MTTNLFDLSGKVALITGSSQGVGLALGNGLASASARIILNGRDGATSGASDFVNGNVLHVDGGMLPSL